VLETHAGYKDDDVSYGVELAEAWMEDVDQEGEILPGRFRASFIDISYCPHSSSTALSMLVHTTC
jgi:hypothetical protein